MKRIIALVLVFIFLLTGCNTALVSKEDETTTKEATEKVTAEENIPKFSGLDDEALLPYVESQVYSNLVSELNSDKYFVENINATYVSKEYLEEIEYNSKENIFFGYSLSELDRCFQGKKYIFTVNENGKTIVTDSEKYDDTYDRIIKNVAIGCGVIFVCATVSLVTAGAGLPAVSMIFAVSAKTGAIMGASSGTLGGTAAGVLKYIETGNLNESLKEAELSASEGFKFGVITGAISGGVGESVKYANAMKFLKGVELNGLTLQEAASIQMESNYPIDVIKQFANMEQYKICKEAGLKPYIVNGKTMLIRDIDTKKVDEFGRTNFERMSQGLAALDSSGQAYELHHIGQEADSTLAILTKTEHMKNGNDKIWHILDEATKVHGEGNTWNSQRQQIWKALAKVIGG